MSEPTPSTKPYLIRALHEWCADAGYTPYLAVKVDDYTQVPMAYVKDGKIVLNIGIDAVRNLHLGNEDITFGGRFGGVAHQIIVPMSAVIGIFSKETGQGMGFQDQDSTPMEADVEPEDKPPTPSKPKLTVVK